MLQIALWKRIVILLTCLSGLWLAMPNAFYTTVEQHNDAVAAIELGATTPENEALRAEWPEWLPSGLVNLGLDLRGGAHLLAEVQVYATCTPPVSGTGGDPHFTTFKGEHYDFHGHCDLVFLQNDDFRNGLGMALHVRSSPLKTIFSYVSHAALRIGSDIFEVTKGAYYINGKEISRPGEGKALRGFPLVTTKSGTGKVYTFHIDKNSHTKIVFREQHSWLRVKVINATSETFGASLGLMGSYWTGKLLARDGQTEMTEDNDDVR